MNEIEQMLFGITVAWNSYEDQMGEQAALEVACSEHGKDVGWYYDLIVDHHEIVNKELKKLYGQK